MYRVRTYEEAQATLDALPIGVLAGYGEVLDVLELTPWNGAPLNEANLRLCDHGCVAPPGHPGALHARRSGVAGRLVPAPATPPLGVGCLVGGLEE